MHNSYYLELELKLVNEISSLKNSADIHTAFKVSSNYYAQILNYIHENEFQSELDEIYFFKHVKPKFQSKVILFMKLQQIKNELPLGCVEVKRKFLEHFLYKINIFYNENKSLIQYYLNDETSFDNIYFVRNKFNFTNKFESIITDVDFKISTYYDHKIAKFLAHQELEKHINKELYLLSANQLPDMDSWHRTQTKLSWTGNKIALIELIYALHYTGVFNNGSADIKTIALEFGSKFGVDIGDIYKGYQEIKERKISRTKFLDKLIENLNQKIDNDDAFLPM